VLLRSLAGRIQNLHITGEIIFDGDRINPYDIKNSVGYVPQDDFLSGELTARETLTNNALMKNDKSSDIIDEDVEKLLKSFGLDHVADNAIGTIFVRGLSGGQRKRVEVCSELISPTKVLLLDEPTSGLDGAIAYEILSVIKQILKEKNGELSVILSIHQPNSRILALFDHIMLLGGGESSGGTLDAGNGMLFFGTLPESIDYFDSIGFAMPAGYTPTDLYLQITDNNFGSNQSFDFEGSYAASMYSRNLKALVAEYARLGRDKLVEDIECDSSDINVRWKPNQVGTVDSVYDTGHMTTNISVIKYPLWRQYATLVGRDFTLGRRDPSLYYLQFGLTTMFGFLIGCGKCRAYSYHLYRTNSSLMLQHSSISSRALITQSRIPPLGSCG
jgi:ABC-type cobalamin/Fe3+-siderophores transport system ATPase subunit